MNFPDFITDISLDVIIEICIIFLIAFTALAFGSVGLGPQIIFISISEFIFFLWLAKAIKAGRIDFTISIFSYLFIAFLTLVIFQSIPLPKFLLKLISPTTYRNYIDFLPGYKEGFMWRSISICPEATKAEFFKALSYGLVGFVIVNNFNKKPQLIRLLCAISITGFAIACFGIIQRYTWNGMIYWIQPVPEGTIAFGPFVNKNHFAGFMELTIPITAMFVFIAERIEKKIFFGFMAAVMLLALFLCLSRAGILSFFVATSFILSVLFLRRSLIKYLFYILPAVLIISIFIFFVVKGPLIERFSSAPEAFSGRLRIYKDVLRMFRDFPLFGVGLGNFGNIFSMYKSFSADLIFRHPDSDWLQFLTEAGLSGFLCIVTFIWLFLKDILYCHFLGRGRCAFSKDTHLRHDRFVLLVISAGLVSITSIVLHGILDINLHIPSNMFLTCIIGALLMATAHIKFKEDANR